MGSFQSQLSPIQRAAKLNSLNMKTLVVVAVCGLAAVSAVPRPNEDSPPSGPNPNAEANADAHYGYWGGWGGYGGWGWGGFTDHGGDTDIGAARRGQSTM